MRSLLNYLGVRALRRAWRWRSGPWMLVGLGLAAVRFLARPRRRA